MPDNPPRTTGKTAIVSALILAVIAATGFLAMSYIVSPPAGNIQQSRTETGDGANCQANCTEAGSPNQKPADGAPRDN